MGEVMKRDGGLVEAMGGCRPPTPAPAGWVRPLRPESGLGLQGKVLDTSKSVATQGSSWGYLQSQFSIDLVNFWRQMPTKWLQERAQGSKNEHGMPPHRGLRGLLARKRRTPTRCAADSSGLVNLSEASLPNGLFLLIR